MPLSSDLNTLLKTRSVRSFGAQEILKPRSRSQPSSCDSCDSVILGLEKGRERSDIASPVRVR